MAMLAMVVLLRLDPLPASSATSLARARHPESRRSSGASRLHRAFVHYSGKKPEIVDPFETGGEGA
jgi:hypothetical protein